MVVANNYKSFKSFRDDFKGTVGFVPTMGALHEGHLSLIKRAKEENENVIVSIFVNPTQFLEGEDLDKYPRKDEADKKICEIAGVDLLYMPTVNSIYNTDELLISAPKVRGYVLEGAKRAGHFDGVLQIVMKLLNITKPTSVYFGKKDAQQLALIKQMTEDYFLGINIVACEIVRDNDGLALSSRNVYLNPSERERALSLSRSLKEASMMIIKKELNSEKIESTMKQILLESVDKLDYVAIVDREFNQLNKVEIGNTIILAAAYVGKTRLIDNIWV